MAIYTLDQLLKNTGTTAKDVKQVGMSVPDKSLPSGYSLSETFGDIKQTGSNLVNTAKETFAKAQEQKQMSRSGEQGMLRGLAKQAGIGLGGISKAGVDLVTGVAKTLVPQSGEEAFQQGASESMKPFMQGIGDTLGFSLNNIKTKYDSLDRKQQTDIDAILGLGSFLTDISGIGLVKRPVVGALKAGEEAVSAGFKTVTNVAKNVPDIIPAVKNVPNVFFDRIATENPVKLAKIKTGVANNLNEYADEFSRSRNAVSGATNKIDGYDYGTHVAEKNLLPDVTDSGRFDGRNIIKGVQDENGQLKTFLNTKLDDSARNTNLEEFKTGLMEDITKKGGIADAESMRGFVDRYVNEIRNRYGDNLSDKVLYAIKSDADAGYNYLSPNADINASKIIADRARQSIRSSDPEIAKALDEMTKNYETIRITQSLESYKVKAGNLTTRLAQLGGSLLGANAVEGGILQTTLAATLGALTGQKLVKALQQAAFISPASRRAIEKELMRKVKPEAVKTILKKLDKGVNLSDVEAKALERAGNQLKNSSIITNDKTTATNTSIPKSISPIEKKSNQAGIIKISDTDRDIITKDLLSIDTLPVTVNGKLEFGNTDDYFRIQQLQDKVDKKILTDAEYIEAKNLVNKVLNRKSNTKKGATAINPLTVGAGVTALGAGGMYLNNKK